MTTETGTGQDTTAAANQQAAATAAETTPATPQAPASEQPAQDQQPAGQSETKPEVTYEFKMPEGIELDKEVADEFTTLAKEAGIAPDKAQRVADLGAKLVQRQIDAHAKTVSTWVEQVKNDPEIGGEKLEENLAIARKAIDVFGSRELKDVLASTGLGNHPAVVRAFLQAGKRITEDAFVGGNRSASTEKDPAKILFPSMN